MIDNNKALTYQRPSDDIVRVVEGAFSPSLKIGPGDKHLVYLEQPSLPGISALAKAELKLAGLVLHPDLFSVRKHFFFTGMQHATLEDPAPKPIAGLPDNARISDFVFSPNGECAAFTITTEAGVFLWLYEAEKASVRPLFGQRLNRVFGGASFRWLSDSKRLLVLAVPEDIGEAPKRPAVPLGPIVQEGDGGQAAANRTFQHLLKTPHDAALFDYYAESELWRIDLKGQAEKLGIKDKIIGLSPSPDARYFLMRTLERPYSYVVQYNRFPQRLKVYETDSGAFVKEIAALPLAENIPLMYGSTRKGVRGITWRADAPASLYFAEALDEGDASKEVAFRDEIFDWLAPFDEPKRSVFKTRLRFAGMTWCSDEIAIYQQWRWKDRKVQLYAFSPADPKQEHRLLFDLNWEDVYNDPGSFCMEINEYGRSIIRTSVDGASFFLKGAGASPEGSRPFLDRYDIATGETERLWRSEAPYFDQLAHITKSDESKLVLLRQSVEQNPNFHLYDLKSGDMTALTHYPHPHPQLNGLTREKIKYTRQDGVQLSGNLYLPPGYDKEKDGSLPLLMWAYPQEFKSADHAGQRKDSPYQFVGIGPSSHLLMLLAGYAILDDPKMPIIGEGEEEPNDLFIEQLIANAEAAIGHLVEDGIADQKRIAIGGHSYGAFMTANLLAHTDLFAAGIARSGAYNRTLTPFGFQMEERTLWQAPKIYSRMSPFMHADQMKTPLLLIHGADDSNSGTYPMQSERFFNALTGHGATVRLVMLPKEGHGYLAKESVMHVHWEMNSWLDKHVKDLPMVEQKEQ